MESAPRLTVVYSPVALAELEEIWEWNIERQGARQAREYRQFLLAEINELGASFDLGRLVTSRPDLRFVTLRWRIGGPGHVVVYRVGEEAGVVTIAHIFHTRQDWKSRLANE